MSHKDSHVSGYIGIVGRPNVGKSTLLNRLIDYPLSITTPKMQTTRHRILGIKSSSEVQLIFIDTPGVYYGEKSALNRYMNRTALGVLDEADIILFVCQADKYDDEDTSLLEKLPPNKPLIIALNKIDLLANKQALLPMMAHLQAQYSSATLVPVAALNGDGIPLLEQALCALLPHAPPLYPEDQVTDKSLRFLAAERIREKLFIFTSQELPYALSVEIESFTESPSLYRINALIWVAREGQKGILIGKNGAMLKKVGASARKSLERLFARKVYLQLWVKVRSGWQDDARALQDLGYSD